MNGVYFLSRIEQEGRSLWRRIDILRGGIQRKQIIAYMWIGLVPAANVGFLSHSNSPKSVVYQTDG
jgi:hypothetical protein